MQKASRIKNSNFVMTQKGKVSLVELCEGKEAMAMLFAAA